MSTGIMKVQKFIPSEILRPYVKAFMIIESENGMENRIIPDTSVAMAFRFKGVVSEIKNGTTDIMPAAVITGIRKNSRLIQYASVSSTLIVSFHEAGASAFFKLPLHELFGITVSLDNLIDQQTVLDVEDQLSCAKSHAQRILIIETFLRSMLIEDKTDKLIVHAIHKINQAHGLIRIQDLVAELPISTDAFEKRFRKTVGTSAKQFSSIVRLKFLISQHPNHESLTETALAAGYFDQAHFIKDFKSFTGQTPTDFFKLPPQW
jgi:AraC-like DNA-binding protein